MKLDKKQILKDYTLAYYDLYRKLPIITQMGSWFYINNCFTSLRLKQFPMMTEELKRRVERKDKEGV
jgi:hypothetical protein